MNVVIDTSMAIAISANPLEKPTSVGRAVSANPIAPAWVHWEIGDAFPAMSRCRRISLNQAESTI